MHLMIHRVATNIALLVALINLCFAQGPPDSLLLDHFRPRSIYKVPVTTVEQAAFPVIDMHSHAYAQSPEEIDLWVQNMDAVGIEKTMILSKEVGAAFDSIYALYAGRYPERFQVWCGLDYSGYDQPGFGPAAVAELERCKQAGATGVGELGDKGRGLVYCDPVKAVGMHLDDSRMDPLLEACGRLELPVAIHVADPIWMYQPMDSTNDGLMNAYSWRLDDQEDILDLPGLITTLENAIRRHPETTFIAVHFANLSYDLVRLGELLDRYPNLYADNSARYAETAPIPRHAAEFYGRYQSRILFGTDMGFDQEMYRVTFRILETHDEHFYEIEQFDYHWPLYGLGLDKKVLKLVYRTNALKVLGSK